MLLKWTLSIFSFIAAVYAFPMLLFVLGHYLIGERWTIIAFLNSFAHLLILPCLLLFPLSLLARQWWLSVALLPSIVFFALTWGMLFLPSNKVQATSDEAPLRVLSYNMRSDSREASIYLNLIRAANADIVALQELGHPEALMMESNLSDIYPYMALHPKEWANAGQGILSKFPLSEDSYWQYDYLPLSLGHQRVIADLGNSLSLSIYNLHPVHAGMTGTFFNPTYHARETNDLLTRINNEEGRLILLGDFNMTDASDDYSSFRRHYRDAFQEAGFGFGWTFTMEGSPAFLRLDYLFYSDGIRALSAEVWPDIGGSDHYPLLVELLLTKP